MRSPNGSSKLSSISRGVIASRGNGGSIQSNSMRCTLGLNLRGWLDQLDLIAFRCVNEGNDAAAAGLGGSITERVAQGFRVLGKGNQIWNGKGQVGDVIAHLHLAAAGEFRELQRDIRARQPHENQLGAAR